jgi:hypothetical protein
METFCSGSNDVNDACSYNEGSALICNGYLQGIVSSCSESFTQYTDTSVFYYWLLINQLNENPYQLLDIAIVRKSIGGILDVIAWYFDSPKLADQFEVIKFFF